MSDVPESELKEALTRAYGIFSCHHFAGVAKIEVVRAKDGIAWSVRVPNGNCISTGEMIIKWLRRGVKLQLQEGMRSLIVCLAAAHDEYNVDLSPIEEDDEEWIMP